MKINGKVVKEPSRIQPNIIKIQRADRTASGKKVVDVIAVKRELNVEYTIISQPELKEIIDELESVPFPTIEFPDAVEGDLQIVVCSDSYTMTPGAVVDGSRLFRDIKFVLEER